MQKIRFKKTGKTIKASIEIRCQDLEGRLALRNEGLEKLLDDRQKVRSYMLRQSQGMRHEYGNPPIMTDNHILSEEVEEINQMCKRLYQLEQEIGQLRLIQSHLTDDEVFELDLADLIRYGFQTETT